MIEQVLYRRTVEQGYNEYSSRGLSKEEAHRVNVVMDTVASDIGDLGSGADSPFMLYPFETMHRFCLATFQREFSKGRSNAVNHGLLIEDMEYRELVKNPEQLWGFTNRNFLSRRMNHREEMFALTALDISPNAELSKEFIFEEYNLNNKGFLKFINAIYTSLSTMKYYSCGLRIDNSKDANKVMRHLGYLIMSMLPYELRDKISFCSRSVPDSIDITVQILQEKDPEKTTITYDIIAGECIVNNTSVEITDFYLDGLFLLTDAELRDYFNNLATFKEGLHLSVDSETEHVISKLFVLSQKPSVFASETAETQLAFINDVFSLPTTNIDVINPIVVRLLPFVDPNHYMQAFSISFGLHRKMDPEKESERQIMTQIEDSLVHYYRLAKNEEKKQLFTSVFDSEEAHAKTSSILKRFIEINEIELDDLLLDEYVKLYEEFFETEWMTVLCSKIIAVFKQNDISGKVRIWNRMFNSANSDAKYCFIYNVLGNEEEPFYKAVFNSLVELYKESHIQQIKEQAYACICDVIHKENDKYRLRILREYNNVHEVEDSLWLEAYNAIENYQSVAADAEFLKCLKDKYYSSSNSKTCNLYLDYLGSVPVSELESIIRQYGKQTETNEREDRLLYKVIYFLINDKKRVSIPTLKSLATIVNEEGVNDVASYISTLYLSASSESSIEIYEFLEVEQPRVFNNPFLNKERLPSYDGYLATKMDERILKGDNELLIRLQELAKLQYHDECYAKIKLTIQKWIDKEMAKAENDYERYLKYKEIYGKLRSILQTQFGKLNCDGLLAQAQDGFWNSSSISTFDYEHCNMYTEKSVVFSQKFSNHENHVLAERISGLIEDSYANWDKVYGMLLSKECVPQDGIREQIINGFNKAYIENDLSKSDPDYIAFVCVNKDNFKMDYTKLFDMLQEYNYRIDERSIHGMKIFEYVGASDQLRKKISEYKNYQSDDPSYGEVIRGLLFEQIALFILLIANNVFRAIVIRMSENLKTRDLLLRCNYIGYILLIVGVAFMSILFMKRANMRRSQKYDKAVFGLLIVNVIISTAAILLSAVFASLFICLPATIVLVAVLLVLTVKAGDTIGKKHKYSYERRR